MKLSVIVPAYNLADYIGACLKSLLEQQTTFSYEVIVANDASTDQTLAEIQRYRSQYPEKLRVINNEQNLGLIGTMIRLLALAEGDYIAYLDGDDLALPGKLQRQVDYLNTHPECAICYHESDMFDSDSDTHIKFFSKDYYNHQYIPQQATIEHLIKYGVFLQASSIMFRRHQHLQESLQHGCRIICDYPWHIANAHYGNGSVDFIDQVLGRYRVHQNSFGAQTNRDVNRRTVVTKELEKACEQALAFGIDPDVVKQGICHHRFSAALYFLRLHQYALFNTMIEASVYDDWFFDDRHQFSFNNRYDFNLVHSYIFSS